MAKRLLPTGECWCGCGEETASAGSFFIQGHDRIAEAAVIMDVYGGVPQLLDQHGFAPGQGKNPRQVWSSLRERGRR